MPAEINNLVQSRQGSILQYKVAEWMFTPELAACAMAFASAWMVRIQCWVTEPSS